MEGDWREMKLGDAIELKRGYDLPSRDRRDGRFPIVSSSGISGRHTEAKAKAPGVVIGRYGTLGEVHYVAEDYWPLNTALYVRDFKGNDPRFVSYLLRSLDFGAYSDKAAVPGLNRNDLHTELVSLPLLPEQRAIAHILGTLDDKIELNRRMNETLEAMARALFKSWFVDFDPVRAKAEGRNPGLPQPLADLFPDSFEDSDLGEIPRGWTVGPILAHARLMSGGTPKTDRSEYWDGPISWASAKDVSQSSGSILVDTERTITPRGLDESATQMIPAFSSVVVARGATTGRMVLFGRDMAMNQTCYALATTTKTPFALYCRLRVAIDALIHAAHGSVFDTITTSTFASSRIVLPTLPALVAFEERVAPVFQRVLGNICEARTLSALRDGLLPKLISGELRVEDAERFVERAVS
jgi:type I restriction enzyme S subunit